jgi:hypothetical protein
MLSWIEVGGCNYIIVRQMLIRSRCNVPEILIVWCLRLTLEIHFELWCSAGYLHMAHVKTSCLREIIVVFVLSSHCSVFPPRMNHENRTSRPIVICS